MADSTGVEEQFTLIPALDRAREAAARATEATRARETAEQEAPDLPVARVIVDLPLPHLDRPFDYRVPRAMHDRVRAGSRVRVRFAGQDVDGFVLDRVAASDHPGRLSPLRRAVSGEAVLSPEVARLSAAVAEHYAGTRADVLRLAVPPRHAATERQPSPLPDRRGDHAVDRAADHAVDRAVDRAVDHAVDRAVDHAVDHAADLDAARAWWRRYRGGEAMLGALSRGGPARAVWTALPGEDWATGLAHAIACTVAVGRGAVVCVPDRRDLDRLDRALRAVLGTGRHVLLTADLGAAERYRSFLAVARGAVRVAVGTRAAAFAPVRDLGLVALWDDGDDLFAEPRAPYPHTREVLLMRAHDEGCGALLGATARSVEADALVRRGWAAEVVADRVEVRARAPRVTVAGSFDRDLERDPSARSARLPHEVQAAVRKALEAGPVLVQTPRSGYAVVLTCDTCRAPALCRHCSGPLQLTGPHRPPTCRWCAAEHPGRSCPECGGAGLRAPVLGEGRTAEELGRAFPRVPVRRSTGERVLGTVPDRPAIVVATPGAEPDAEHGYAAVVLLDTGLMLARRDLRTVEECVRRWFNAATLARPAAAGGRVLAVGEPDHPALQALVRWDPGGFAEREAAERVSAHLPPASRLAVLSGEADAVESLVAALRLPAGAEVLGPVPDPGSPSGAPSRGPAPAAQQGSAAEDAERVRVVVRVPRPSGPLLSRTLREVQGVRSARKLPHVRVQVDPPALG